MKPQSHPRQQSALKFFARSPDHSVAISLFDEGELTVFIRAPKPQMGVMRYPSLPALLDTAAGPRPWHIAAHHCPAKVRTEVENSTLVGLSLEPGQPFAIFIPAKLKIETVMEIFDAFPCAEILGERHGLHLREENNDIITVDAFNPSSAAIDSGTEGGAP